MTEEEFSIPEITKVLIQQSQGYNSLHKLGASSEEGPRDTVIFKIGKRSAKLVNGVSTLSEGKNSTAIAILGRQIVEDFITLLWVLLDESNAQKYLDAVEASLLKTVRLNLEEGSLSIKSTKSDEDKTTEFLNSDRFDNKTKLINVEARAREAKVYDLLYNVIYRNLSIETHGHSGMSENSDNNESDTYAYLSMIVSITRCVGFVSVNWLEHRQRTDNEILRELLGINEI